MKKTTILMVLALTVGKTYMHAQSAEAQKDAFGKGIILGFNAGIGTKGDSRTPIVIEGQLGYRFIPRMYAFAKIESSANLYSRNGNNTWACADGLGGGLGYTLAKSGPLAYHVEASVLTSIGAKKSNDFRQTIYDVRAVQQYHELMISLGYRHTTSRTAGYGDYNGLFVSIGYRF